MYERLRQKHCETEDEILYESLYDTVIKSSEINDSVKESFLENIKESLIDMPKKPADSSITQKHAVNIAPIAWLKAECAQTRGTKKLAASEGNLKEEKPKENRMGNSDHQCSIF
eukprot:TRINITY_DN1893_c0_g9_i1.p2 TRINITY_DN1893_c0_g9~~TRINITY_DN1893_c0_g9_i1.p2  ORF type:complete len:114 (-),score=31.87 TRINITY_DN1893_c0_g9_i1:111-452(-)